MYLFILIEIILICNIINNKNISMMSSSRKVCPRCERRFKYIQDLLEHQKSPCEISFSDNDISVIENKKKQRLTCDERRVGPSPSHNKFDSMIGVIYNLFIYLCI